MGALVSLDTLLADRRLWRGQPTARPASAEPTGHAALDAALPSGGWPESALVEVLLPADGLGELRLVLPTLANAALSMVLGMTLILQALKHGDAGMVAILSSVSPVLVLPLLWLVYKRRPAAGAWLGAALTVGGTVLILMH